jgi:hypothetical protein
MHVQTRERGTDDAKQLKIFIKLPKPQSQEGLAAKF